MPTPSQLIDKLIADLPAWQGACLTNLRAAINEADPDLVEAWKWDTPVWAYKGKGNVCAIGAFKDHVKINFLKGASLPDPNHLFNAGLEAKASRAIDLAEGDSLDMPAFKELVRAAVTKQRSGTK